MNVMTADGVVRSLLANLRVREMPDPETRFFIRLFFAGDTNDLNARYGFEAETREAAVDRAQCILATGNDFGRPSGILFENTPVGKQQIKNWLD